MKKIIALIVSLSLFCSAVTVYAEETVNYNCSDWARESIEAALSHYLIEDSEQNFKENISRVEFCELIFRLVLYTPYAMDWYWESDEESLELPEYERAFEDIENERVEVLRHIGIISGKTETQFAPDDNLTREEAATIIIRMLDVTSPMEATELWYEYGDIDNISNWALTSVQRISNLGFMQGVGDNRFAPQDTITKEQAIVTAIKVYDANILDWLYEVIKRDAGVLGYVYENDTWNYITYDMAVGRRVKPIDTDKDEFEVLENEKFAKDRKKVYLMGKEIEDADPETFQIITDDGYMRYAKDKNFVYIYLEDGGIMKVFGADPETFEVLEYPYSKDKNDAYNGCLPLYVDDVTKFEVIEAGNGWTRISFADSFLSAILKSEEVAEYNNEKYGFVDNAVIYSEEGKAKTEKLVYEGYMLVEDNR